VRRARCCAVATALAVATATGCAPAADDDRVHVVVDVAPLAYVAARVAGDEVRVTTLTPPGADPHSVELSPAAVAELGRADLVVHVSGLQPSTDEALAQTRPSHVVDALAAATVQLPDGGEPPDPGRDPHFWLDPVRLGLAAQQVAEALEEVDSAGAEDHRSRADALVEDLEALDAEYRATLGRCAGATLVTSHEAFGYLAARYDLRQEGIAGIDPEVEPSPARLREVAEVVDRTGVRTLFLETAASPRLVERLASDLDVGTAVLDPMERPSDPDYLAVMRANLTALSEGLVCEG
jgi:zinc transport system substrate-binding protein